ncbi:NADH-quinone oxidoreductase subunit L [Limibacter armeniacum]|uniref:NADH-quinone oxidoreductase subunit 5 family protein n=1 Tax=Limibacter armeniacum TaxID=466084 RepID=UPI002FE50B18
MNLFITILFLSVLAPLLSFLLLSIRRQNRWADIVSIGFLSISAILSSALLIQHFIGGAETLHLKKEWLHVAGYTVAFGVKLDTLSHIMLAMVSLVSLLVHIFSSSYMHGDPNFKRYFSLLGLFTFAMFGVIITDNLLLIYIFWELVGFSSYLLIGFWRTKESAVRAAKKAFVVNRFGDAGFMLSLMIIFAVFHTTDLDSLYQAVKGGEAIGVESWLLVLAGFGLFLGAIAKSAQVPMAVWLPDAMQGPTPVSALIHAATMVAAGIYLLIRMNFLLTPEIQHLITLTGTVTAFMAGFAALTQYDIKRILAFSTISQLGYMMVGIGVGAVDASFFHLITHAFFKAGLFLGAGSVIHSMHQVSCDICKGFDAQDIRFMGNLRKYMPKTFVGFTICAAALAGLPFFSGFLSKDAILAGTMVYAEANGGIAYLVPVMGFLTALLTAIYAGRLIFTVFFGDLGIAKKCPSCFIEPLETGKRMVYPILLLAALSLWVVYSINPFGGHNWITDSVGLSHLDVSSVHLMAEVISVLLAVTGVVITYMMYVTGTLKPLKNTLFPRNSWMRSLSFNFFYLNEIYNIGAASFIRTARVFNNTATPESNIVKGTLWLSVFVRNFDNGIVDAFVRFFGVTNVIIAHLYAFFDRYFVDGVVNGIVFFTGRAGLVTRSVQGGKLQVYLVWAILLLVLLIWIII